MGSRGPHARKEEDSWGNSYGSSREDGEMSRKCIFSLEIEQVHIALDHKDKRKGKE